jgi:hypothetical protein
MKTKNNAPSHIDEVERCRQVRRTLEETYGTLEGLCDWLKKLQSRMKKVPRTAKPKQLKRRGN